MAIAVVDHAPPVHHLQRDDRAFSIAQDVVVGFKTDAAIGTFDPHHLVASTCNEASERDPFGQPRVIIATNP
jgi:hypothetical protein